MKGRRFTHLSLSGSYYLLFFGHTLCPDATPLTLHKITQAQKMMKRMKENQYIRCKCVFVTVKPDTDTVKDLTAFKQMFSPDLIVLRAESNKSESLVRMMRNFHVPVGLSPEEQERALAYFEKQKKEDKSWFNFIFQRKKVQNLYFDNDHSRAIYLMSPENQFLQFYDIDVEAAELAQQVTEEISYDIGTRHVGQGTRPLVAN